MAFAVAVAFEPPSTSTGAVTQRRRPRARTPLDREAVGLRCEAAVAPNRAAMIVRRHLRGAI